ncbi:alpha/beta family hydrolase [Candidatus Sororendozoicomonas aggregata]|uniref:alpha/beta family hydrolase n=1 Tax=Candidatus Sororendozoicomonas aggregata TaxID=3073239 RepID=UPI002ED2FAF6
MDSHSIWNWAEKDSPVLILAHGAGAGMSSPFMDKVAKLLCQQGVSVVRFEFPYMRQMAQTGKRRPPDKQSVLLDVWSGQIEKIRKEVSVPLFIGGKSMGGRMASLLMAQREYNATVSGVVCLGYPFYPAGKLDKPRTAHLTSTGVPHLIIQGERDAMGNRETVSHYDVSDNITIHWLPDGNHDLKPRKASGYTHQQHLEQATRQVVAFVRQ